MQCFFFCSVIAHARLPIALLQPASCFKHNQGNQNKLKLFSIRIKKINKVRYCFNVILKTVQRKMPHSLSLSHPTCFFYVYGCLCILCMMLMLSGEGWGKKKKTCCLSPAEITANLIDLSTSALPF